VKYFGRTAPNDAQQGIVMGRILSDDQFVGADSAAFLFVSNPYGQGLAEQARAEFSGETTAMVGYDPQTSNYTSTLDQVFADDPEAVGFVGYPGNGRTILNQWQDGGYGGEWVLSEGLNSAEFLQGLSDITSGMYVASPNPEQTEGATAFEEKIGEANTLFAPHAYDAMFLMALAMEAGGEASGTAIAENIRSVSRPEGEAMPQTTPEGTETTMDDGAAGNVVTVGEFSQVIADGALRDRVPCGQLDRTQRPCAAGEDLLEQADFRLVEDVRRSAIRSVSTSWAGVPGSLLLSSSRANVVSFDIYTSSLARCFMFCDDHR